MGKARVWHLIVSVAVVAGGLWLQSPVWPPAPDFTGRGFTSVHVRLRGNLDHRSPEEQAELADVMSVVPPAVGSSADPAVVAELAEVLRSGKPVVVCRCAALGSLEFCLPDGTAERVLVMPAHDAGSVEFRYGKGRYRVSREWFLRVAAPLGIPTARWYGWPTAEAVAASDRGGR